MVASNDKLEFRVDFGKHEQGAAILVQTSHHGEITTMEENVGFRQRFSESMRSIIGREEVLIMSVRHNEKACGPHSRRICDLRHDIFEFSKFSR